MLDAVRRVSVYRRVGIREYVLRFALRVIRRREHIARALAVRAFEVRRVEASVRVRHGQHILRPCRGLDRDCRGNAVVAGIAFVALVALAAGIAFYALYPLYALYTLVAFFTFFALYALYTLRTL